MEGKQKIITLNIHEKEAEVQTAYTGYHTIFGTGCYVGPRVRVGNGCIIGAGCRIMFEEIIPDHTVVAGTRKIGIGFDTPVRKDPLNEERQHDEVDAMCQIFHPEFCSYSTSSKLKVVFEAHIPLCENFKLELSSGSTKRSTTISHLPPIKLSAILPESYPSLDIPLVTLSCSWLGIDHLNILIQELEKLWNENKCEILYIWSTFLIEKTLELLEIKNSYDLVDKLGTKKTEQTQSQGNVAELTDHLQSLDVKVQDQKNFVHVPLVYCSSKETCKVNHFDLARKETELFQRKSLLGIYHSLVQYNATKSVEQFNKGYYDCNVCFSRTSGVSCKQLSCSHITCLECLKGLCEVNIDNGTMGQIVCPEVDCGYEIPTHTIREMVSEEKFDRYDRLILNKALDSMDDVIYCPHSNCRTPLVCEDMDDPLGICFKCDHAFCIFCNKTYHGVEPCHFEESEKKVLVSTYLSASYDKKQELERKHGKKPLQNLVRAVQSAEWLELNTKQCPNCAAKVEKNKGCNKIYCTKCSSAFCWLCLRVISPIHRDYGHFLDYGSPCYSKLFIGLSNEELSEIFPDEDVEAWEDQ